MASTGALCSTLREGNKVGDRLANMGVDQGTRSMVSHSIPLEDIIPLLEADMRRVAFERV